VHSYYHMVPLVCYYCSVGYISDSVDYSLSSLLEWFTDVGVLPRISSADEETFGFTHECGTGFKSFSEAPRLAWKCGTLRSDNPIRDL
jgi:hypothetical protein